MKKFLQSLYGQTGRIRQEFSLPAALTLICVSLFLPTLMVDTKLTIALRGSFFALGALLATLELRGLFWLVLITPLFELFTLQIGLPNQFIIMNTWLGWTAYTILFNHAEKFPPLAISRAPLSILLMAMITFTGVKWIPQFIEIIRHSEVEISLFELIRSFLHGLWQWDIVGSLYHDLAVVFGYLVAILAFVAIKKLQARHPQILVDELCWQAITYSIIPIMIVFFLQQVQVLSEFGTYDHGSTFQNGNHLSYFGGLSFLASLYFKMKMDAPFKSRVLNITIILSLIAIAAGAGRTTWLTLPVSIFCAFLAASYFCKHEYRQNFLQRIQKLSS